MKMKMILCLIFFCSFLDVYAIGADENSATENDRKKYQLSICSIFKNEANNLAVWLEYHLALGVDHFYLYNVGSTDSFRHVLMPYIEDDLVTLVNWPEVAAEEDNYPYVWALSTQVPAYENAVNFVAKDETKWLVFVDIDESLICTHGNLKKLLEEYDDYPGITLTSNTFEGSTQVILPKKKLFAQSVEYPSSDVQIVDISVSKMIFKPDLCAGFNWPPYQCCFKAGQACGRVSSNELRISRYLKQGKTIPRKNERMFTERKTKEGNFPRFENSHTFNSPEHPIYERIPNFLKKIQSSSRLGYSLNTENNE